MKPPPLQTVYAALRNHRQITRVQVSMPVCVTVHHRNDECVTCQNQCVLYLSL